ncbi:MAG: glycosyltransferase family 39 protein, partial [Candidatus Eremiobacteraeota bacterium]|nr:glycosyltransferase family 39 protein [Candidatus Eremiobacteraeota bacterium]
MVAAIGRRWFWCAVLTAILLGIAFRVVHAERRLFWGDETYTALRVSGHWDREFRGIFNGSVYSTDQLLAFQRVDPHRPLSDTVDGLAVEDPHHPPLFYVIERLWAGVAGSSIFSLRAVAVVFGVLAVAAAYWFLIELSGNRLVAGTGAALMSVSPFFVNYSGQAREYTLFMLLVSVASALLLRAARLGSRGLWLGYALALAIGLYSDLLMTGVLVSHLVYVLVVFRSNRRVLMAFGSSVAFAIICFAPWTVIVIHQWNTVSDWMEWVRTPYTPVGILTKWLFNIAAVLFDAEYAMIWLAPLAVAVLALFAFAIFRLIKSEPFSISFFIVTLGLGATIEQLVNDLLSHAHSATIARYMTPLWMAILFSV